MAKVINASDFENEVIKSDKPVLADFFTTWCGPCKMLSPILDQVSDEIQDIAKIVKIDADQAKEMAAQYAIKSVPTMLFFKNGEVVDRAVGVLQKDEIKEKIMALTV